MDITYSDGSIVKNCVVQIWNDLHEEKWGFFRAFWCASPEATTGSPVIGYCSAGGAHRTIKRVAAEVWRLHPDAEIYRNGRRMLKHPKLAGEIATRRWARKHTCEDASATPCTEPLATMALVHLDKGPYVFYYCTGHGERLLQRAGTWQAGPDLIATDEGRKA